MVNICKPKLLSRTSRTCLRVTVGGACPLLFATREGARRLQTRPQQAPQTLVPPSMFLGGRKRWFWVVKTIGVAQKRMLGGQKNTGPS